LGKNADIVMEKRANYQQGIMSIGGKILLTKTLLIFKPHDLNICRKEIVIELKDIIDVGKTETKLGLSKEIWVHSKGTHERFVVWGRDEFIHAIKNQVRIGSRRFNEINCGNRG